MHTFLLYVKMVFKFNLFFQEEEIDILVLTEVAARGLNIPGVQTVINYIMPPTIERYIVRSSVFNRICCEINVTGRQNLVDWVSGNSVNFSCPVDSLLRHFSSSCS